MRDTRTCTSLTVCVCVGGLCVKSVYVGVRFVLYELNCVCEKSTYIVHVRHQLCVWRVSVRSVGVKVCTVRVEECVCKHCMPY